MDSNHCMDWIMQTRKTPGPRPGLAALASSNGGRTWGGGLGDWGPKLSGGLQTCAELFRRRAVWREGGRGRREGGRKSQEETENGGKGGAGPRAPCTYCVSTSQHCRVSGAPWALRRRRRSRSGRQAPRPISSRHRAGAERNRAGRRPGLALASPARAGMDSDTRRPGLALRSGD